MMPAGHLPILLSLSALLLSPLLTGSLALSAPEFTKRPQNMIGVSGGVVSFVCQATGDPKPRVTWNKIGKRDRVPSLGCFSALGIGTTIEFDEGAGAVLRIQSLQAPRDESIYECVAENSEGKDSVQATLSIIREDLLPVGFPSIDMGPQLKVVERTHTAIMVCAASGNPDPKITWFKDFPPIDPSTSNGRIKQLRSGALQIENTEENDQGKYECVASNIEGVRYSSPANLYVRVRRIPPRFSILPTNHEILLGGSVNITCVAMGSPMPYVKWMLNSEDLTPEDEIPVGRNVLELNGVRESANYTCVAMNSQGIIEAVAQITVKFPGQPTNFQVGEVSNTSVELTWEPAFEKEGIISYELHYKEGSQGAQVKKTFGPTSSYVVEGLSANTEYYFSLAAVSNKGIGAFTHEISQRTSQASVGASKV